MGRTHAVLPGQVLGWHAVPKTRRPFWSGRAQHGRAVPCQLYPMASLQPLGWFSAKKIAMTPVV